MKKRQGQQINRANDRKLRADIRRHLHKLRLPKGSKSLSKKRVRVSHKHQRTEIYELEKEKLAKYWTLFSNEFANGAEVDPECIDPYLVPVVSGEWTGYLFRFACLLWSVPVSKGFGRRMRYLVYDKQNHKLIGLFALGDPVFNLRVRDEWIGWDVKTRQKKLVNVMDAYVAGAVPPYNSLLGGKLVFSILASREVHRAFIKKYGKTKGIISKKRKSAKLALITVTSALGRSSLYNRLKLYRLGSSEPSINLIRLGETRGFGHFHLSNGLFYKLRELLAKEGHPYAAAHKYGNGPNWRFRVIRVGLKKLGLDEELLKHGIVREVFCLPLAVNTKSFLTGKSTTLRGPRLGISEITKLAKIRWILPRAQRRQDYRNFKREDIYKLVKA